MTRPAGAVITKIARPSPLTPSLKGEGDLMQRAMQIACRDADARKLPPP